MSWICSNCGTENLLSASVCSECGCERRSVSNVEASVPSDDAVQQNTVAGIVGMGQTSESARETENHGIPFMREIPRRKPFSNIIHSEEKTVRQNINTILTPNNNDTNIMRCSKCGYVNSGGSTCIKCGTPLQGDNLGVNNLSRKGQTSTDSYPTRIMNGEVQQLKQTVVQSGGGMSATQLKQTVVQGRRSGDEHWSQGAQTREQVIPYKDESGQLRCPKCTYPVTSKLNSCPNCGVDFTNTESGNVSGNKPQDKIDKVCDDKNLFDFTNICDNCNKEVPGEYSFCPYCGSKIIMKTRKIDYHVTPTPEPDEEQGTEEPVSGVCRLIPLTEDNTPIGSTEKKFEGSTIVLNRKNTDPNNRTITSKEQAKLYFIDGKWYVENFSQYNSTLLVVGRKMELQPDDIIILGDRKFKFETGE